MQLYRRDKTKTVNNKAIWWYKHRLRRSKTRGCLQSSMRITIRQALIMQQSSKSSTTHYKTRKERLISAILSIWSSSYQSACKSYGCSKEDAPLNSFPSYSFRTLNRVCDKNKIATVRFSLFEPMRPKIVWEMKKEHRQQWNSPPRAMS